MLPAAWVTDCEVEKGTGQNNKVVRRASDEDRWPFRSQFSSKTSLCDLKLRVTCASVSGALCLVHSKRSAFIYLSLFGAALGLCCCMQAFSSCDEQGLLCSYSMRASDWVASLVVEHGF